MITVTAEEQAMLQNIRVKADELAQLVNHAMQAGYTINFNINSIIGACDRFDVYKMTPIDMKAAAN
jgi:Tfp pilus assembly protein PilV